ncbi:MAG TPA: MFS transporter [Rhodanobacteraceae bacterium]
MLLLASAVLINYVDRGALSTAAPVLKDALRLDHVQVGLLLSAFFWTYTPSQLLAGWALQRYGPHRLMAAGLAFWSLATLSMSFASTFATLMVLRLALGIGQSVTFPGNSQVLAQFPEETRRGTANGIVIAGSPLGQALGTFAGGLLITQYGWRALFLVAGVLSLLWLLPWSGQHLPRSTSSVPDAKPPPFGDILRCRALWGMGIGQFGYNYTLYFCLTWLPMYLVKDRGLAIGQMAVIGGAIYLVYAASSVAAGWACDRRVRAGVPLERARKTSAVGGALGVAACMALCAVAGTTTSIALLFAASVCKGFCGAVNFANAQTLAGPTAAGRWVGIQNCLGNTAGIVAPAITGAIVEWSGNYTYAFAATAAAALLGAFGYGVIVQRVTPVIWSPATPHSRLARQSLAAPATPQLVNRSL